MSAGPDPQAAGASANTVPKPITLGGYHAEALSQLEDPQDYVERLIDDSFLVNIDAQWACMWVADAAGFTGSAILAVDVMNGMPS